MRWLRCALLSVFALGAVACGGDEEAPSVLDPLDLERPDPEVDDFDPSTIVSSDEFIDFAALDTAAVQKFFGSTPYDTRRSFLETYQSNGIRASEAVTAAARRYEINPLVFLVFAQTTQGLVSARTYPFPAERVEYVFGCGCLKVNDCLPELAGFDRQVDCLGSALRVALDDIALDGVTASDWGPDLASLTLDRVEVTPTNDATAAIYARTPRVNVGAAGGTWAFWNVWRLYAEGIGYFGAIGAGG